VCGCKKQEICAVPADLKYRNRKKIILILNPKTFLDPEKAK
jgi:hypothetical protein